MGANLHIAAGASSGSGIYTTEGTVAYYHNVSVNSGGKLLVAELPVHPTKLEQQIEWSKYAKENEASYPSGETSFQSLIYGDTFDLVEMDPQKNKVISMPY